MQKLPRVTFRNDDLDTYIKGLNNENVQKVLFTKLVENLEYSIKKGRKSCNICYFKDYVVFIPQSEFKNILLVIEDYFLKKEDFETCARLRDLKKLI